MGIETALIVASTVIAAGSAVYGGIQQSNAADAQAKLADQQAREEADAARAQAEAIRSADKYKRGQARAALAASGVQVDQGTAVQIDQNIAQNTEQDAFSTLLTGQRRANASQNEASAYRSQASGDLVAGALNGTNSLLSSGTNYYKSKYGRG